MSHNLATKFVNCSQPLKYPDGVELRLIKGMVCPQCAVPIHAFDARRFTDGSMLIWCSVGHDILRLERVVP
jgi:hypothetical protein